MSEQLDYYFSIVSPWAYIGHDAFHEMVARRGVEVAYKPVAVPRVFEQTGSLPLPKRPPSRQALRWMELQRWRDKRGVPLNPKPAYWPGDFSTADRMVIALVGDGGRPAGLIRALHRAIWAEDRDMTDTAQLVSVADAAGENGAALLEKAASQETGAIYDKNTDDAIAAGCFGVPSYVRGGELFWGQDRLEILEDAIMCGREAYTSLA